MINVDSKVFRHEFCKTYGIPITVFESPYFEHFLDLYENHFKALTLWKEFVEETKHFETPEKYLEYKNQVVEAVFTYLNECQPLNEFTQSKEFDYSYVPRGLNSASIYNPKNIVRCLVSIDMRKANFSALHHYNSDIFNGAETYEDFIGQFTDMQCLKDSKYMRQIIFGHYNPKRQQIYERYLMGKVIEKLYNVVDNLNIICYNADEIVIDVTNLRANNTFAAIMMRMKEVVDKLSDELVPLKIEYFTLSKIEGTSGYMKSFMDGSEPVFKAVESIEIPYVVLAYERTLERGNFKDIEHNNVADYGVFYYNGKLARLMDPIHVSF